MSAKSQGSTFEPINLSVLDLYAIEDAKAYAEKLRGELDRVRRLRVAFYEARMGERGSVLYVRKWLVGLGIAALVCSAAAAGFRLVDATQKPTWLPGDPVSIALFLALGCYVAMSALSFWESATASTSGFFRSAEVILALRDLWTQYEFDIAAILESNTRKTGENVATKDKLMSVSQTLATNMDAIARTELGDWKGEFQSSMTQLASAGRDGMVSVKAELKADYDARLKKIELSSEEAKKIAEAAKPKPLAYAMLAIKGDFADTLEIVIDEKTRLQSRLAKTPLMPMQPGTYCLRVSGRDKAGKPLEAAQYVEIKSGPSEIKIDLA